MREKINVKQIIKALFYLFCQMSFNVEEKDLDINVRKNEGLVV